MAGKGKADDYGAEKDLGVDALAEMLYTRGGHLSAGAEKPIPRPIPRALQPTPSAPPSVKSEDIAQLARSMQQAWHPPEPVATPSPAMPAFARSPGLTSPYAASLAPSGYVPAPHLPVQADDGQLLLKASQLADNMQERFQELERRENQLQELMTAFDQEQRRFRLMQQHARDEETGREAQLAEREQEFAQRLGQGQSLLGEIEQREQDIARARHEYEQEKLRLKADLQRELDVERTAMRHERTLIESERKDLQTRTDQLQEEHENNLRQLRRDLEVERRRIRGQTAADLEVERDVFKREREEWLRNRSEQETLLHRQKEAHTAAMQRAEQLLADQQRQQNETAERRRQDIERQCAESQARLDEERRAWDAKRNTENEQLERARFLHVETLRKLEDEKQAREQQLQVSMNRTKEEHSAALLGERVTFDAELQRKREQFAQELERLRERFQEESARHVEQLAAERQRFDEELRLEQERANAERHAREIDFDERLADWNRRRDEEHVGIARERQELERLAIEAEAELAQRRRQLEEEARRARSENMVELRANWDIERQELRRQLAGDIDAERKRLDSEISGFAERQERELAALKRAKESHEAALKQARADIIHERQQANEEMKLERVTQEAHLAAMRGQFEASLKQRFEGTELRVAQEQDSLSKQKAAHQAAVTEAAERLSVEKQRLNQTRTELETTHQQQVEELTQWDRRLQSEAHTQSVLNQQWRRRVEETGLLLRQRRIQLDRFRELLAERERSLVREEDLLARGKAEFDTEKQTDRDLLANQRALLERQRSDITVEKQRQEREIGIEQEKLLERVQRMQVVRKELDDTSLRNLEDRLAAEEALADLISEIGEPAARHRVEEVRTVIAGQIREMQHSARTSQADETSRLVAFTQKQLEEEAARLKLDREAFTRRMNERERELQEEETKLETKSVEWQIREVKWRHMRDDWLKERVEAEQIIRGLLDELSAGVTGKQ